MHCCSPVPGGLKKQEMRDCKGIKTLLAICPSSHRREDLLREPEVFWNLRLSRVSFLPSLFLLSQFPAWWAYCHFHCAGFSCVQLPPRELLPSWASAVLGLGLAGAKLRLFQAGSVQVMAPYYVCGMCNFLGSVWLQEKLEAMGGPVL